MNAMLTQYFNY